MRSDAGAGSGLWPRVAAGALVVAAQHRVDPRLVASALAPEPGHHVGVEPHGDPFLGPGIDRPGGSQNAAGRVSGSAAASASISASLMARTRAQSLSSAAGR